MLSRERADHSWSFAIRTSGGAVVLSMSSMHPRSSGMAVASARRATVTQLTSPLGGCRTRAATAWIVNLVAASDLQSSNRGAKVTLADQLLHFRWKCVTEATTS